MVERAVVGEEVEEAREAGDFAVDLAKMCEIVLDGPRTSWPAKLRFWLLDYELRCVACYRFGRWAGRLRTRRRLVGLLALVLYWCWHRRNLRVHHADIARRADIGPGLLLMHRSGIIVGPALIGSNCVLHQNVTIGQRIAAGNQGVPTIGNDVWIGPGAVISGAITIGDGCTISAGTVLSKDVPSHSLVSGNPGRVIARDYDNSTMINFVVVPGAGRAVRPPAAERVETNTVLSSADGDRVGLDTPPPPSLRSGAPSLAPPGRASSPAGVARSPSGSGGSTSGGGS